MDPAIISAGVGLIGSLFGGRRNSTPSYMAEQYNLRNAADKRALSLYDSTNLEELDAQAVGSLRASALKNAMDALSNYDAIAAGRGSGAYKMDTAKDRSKNQIAADSVAPVAQFEANLATSRPQRKAALLPNVGNNTGAASYLDNFNMQSGQADADMWAQIMQIAGRLANSRGSGSGGRNDRMIQEMNIQDYGSENVQ